METITFQKLWQLLHPSAVFDTRGRYEKCRLLWEAMDEAQRKRIYSSIAAKRQNGDFVHPNPCFALDDAMQEDECTQAKKKPAGPTDYNRRKLPAVPVFSAKYNGKWGMYTQADIDLYGLEKAKT